MKKTSKILSFILCAAMAASAVPSISASADYRYYPMVDFDITKPPIDYSYFQDTDLYKDNIDDFGQYRGLAYRSDVATDIVAVYRDFDTNYLHLTVTDDKWEEIYDKYKDRLGLSCTGKLPDNTVHMHENTEFGKDCTPEECKELIEEKKNEIKEKYEIIMNMCSEMYKAGCISEARYVPINVGYEYYYEINARSFRIKDYGDITIEDIENVINSVSDKCDVSVDAEGAYFVSVNIDGGTELLDEFNAVINAIEEKYSDSCKIDIFTWYRDIAMAPRHRAIYDPLTIDLIAELEKNAGVAYGDANIDNHIGIQDAVLMNKSMVGAVDFNEDQNKVTDLNGDNVVDSEDLSILLQYLVDDIDTFPVAE